MFIRKPSLKVRNKNSNKDSVSSSKQQDIIPVISKMMAYIRVICSVVKNCMCIFWNGKAVIKKVRRLPI